MAGDTQAEPNALVDVYRAAWVVVGRRAYSLNRAEEEQLRCDLASYIGRTFMNGVRDLGELLRRSILHFLH
jgi:hypothetical protein